jgi:hypothetical protein
MIFFSLPLCQYEVQLEYLLVETPPQTSLICLLVQGTWFADSLLQLDLEATSGTAAILGPRSHRLSPK